MLELTNASGMRSLIRVQHGPPLQVPSLPSQFSVSSQMVGAGAERNHARERMEPALIELTRLQVRFPSKLTGSFFEHLHEARSCMSQPT